MRRCGDAEMWRCRDTEMRKVREELANLFKMIINSLMKEFQPKKGDWEG
jgi:hypothetical protein